MQPKLTDKHFGLEILNSFCFWNFIAHLRLITNDISLTCNCDYLRQPHTENIVILFGTYFRYTHSLASVSLSHCLSVCFCSIPEYCNALLVSVSRSRKCVQNIVKYLPFLVPILTIISVSFEAYRNTQFATANWLTHTKSYDRMLLAAAQSNNQNKPS